MGQEVTEQTDNPEFTYITLYLADKSGKLSGKSNTTFNGIDRTTLSLDAIEWLEDNYGPGARGSLEWHANLDNDTFKWGYHGKEPDGKGSLCRVFYFRNETQAMMFKLAWGGA